MQGYYNVYGGGAAAAQYPIYGGGAAAAAAGMVTGVGTFYPYFQFGHAGGGPPAYPPGQGFGLQYPPHVFPYSAMNSTGALPTFPNQYGGPISVAPTPAPQAGLFQFTLKTLKRTTLQAFSSLFF